MNRIIHPKREDNRAPGAAHRPRPGVMLTAGRASGSLRCRPCARRDPSPPLRMIRVHGRWSQGANAALRCADRGGSNAVGSFDGQAKTDLVYSTFVTTQVAGDSPVWRGSRHLRRTRKASARPSPKMEKAIPVTMTARPGKRLIHQAVAMKVLPSVIIAPHSGLGGRAASPR